MILLLLSCGMAFAQYPATGNKQRLGFQTTADGLVWRGSLSDTASIQPTSNQNAWVILDTVNFKFYSFDFTSNVWNQLPSGSTIDTTSLSNRIDLRVRYADTATMLQNYALKYYVDSIANNFQDSINDITNGYFKQQFTSVTSDTLLWTRSVQLPTDENLLLAFRNGQILNNNQYTRIDTNKIKIAANSYKVGENYTIVYVKGGGGSGGGGSSFDTTELNLQARLNLKLNISDTSQMLSNYATKAYADTSGRFYARQDFSNVSSSTLTWTQSDTLVVGGVTVVQVYRNGQILLPTQYTIPTNASVVIGSTAYKAGENYTVIFPRGGGAGSGGGSGSLTSISGGTGITVSPNPITTTGTVSADTTFLFTQSDTLSLNLTSRFAAKLNPADTVSLSNRINAKGSGTVTSVGSGFGLLGGTITTTGTLRLDTTTIYARLQDSIDVAIGGDTIKILKQEYQPATTNILTWTVTSKFPIQLKAYILVFRNGQLLNNDQYNLTDTNKITIVSTSFKSGSNYTVATVSGIGSVGSAQAGNPVYPDAGIALSTGSTWASSITNNSSNWNTAYNDKVNSLAVTGTTTKTITLTQQDGGTVSGNFTDNGSVTSVGLTAPTGFDVGNSPITTNGNIGLTFSNGYSLPTNASQSNWNTAYNDKIASLAFTGTDTKTLTLNQTDGGSVTGTFTDLQGIVSGDTATMLTPYLRKADTTSMLTNYLRTGVAASTYQPLLSGTTNYLPKFTGTSTLGNSTLIDNGTTISTASILSTTNYTSFNTTQTMSSSSGQLSTHRFTSANANGVYDKDWFLTSYEGAPWQGSDLGSGNRSKPPIVAIINNDDPSFINSGLHLMTTNSANNTYTPAITFGVNSQDGIYYNTIGAITAKKLNTGQYLSQSAGQLEFFGTGTSLDATGASMKTANMTLGVGVGIGYTTAPTVRGRLLVSEKIGINDTTPSYTLDVNGTLNATGAATLGSTLAVNGAITEDGLDVIKGSGTSGYIALFTSSDGIDNSPILNQSGIINFDSSVVVSNTLTVGGATYYSGYQIETGTGVNDFDVIAAGTSIYIFENTSAGSGTTTKEFLDSATSNTGRVITISNISDNAWDMAFTSIKPYTKTSTTINQLSSGQSITILSNGAKWLVISRNF